jgi:hypothetical protein
MRLSIISAAVVIGLGIVGIALAQQGDRPPNEPPVNKAKLRAQVAKLRAEVDVLQLEHDAESEFLKKMMIEMKDHESMEAAKDSAKEQMEAVLKRRMAAVAPATGIQAPGGAAAFPMLEHEFDKMADADAAVAKVARPILERFKKEFVQKATALHEKKLELVDLEKQYSEAR